MLFDFIGWCVEVTPAFIHFLTDCLEEPFLEGIRILDQSTHGGLGLQAKDKDGNSLHQCCPRSFISAEDRSQLSAKIQKLLVEEDGHESVYLNQASPTQTFSEETLVQIRNEKNLCTCNVLDLTF